MQLAYLLHTSIRGKDPEPGGPVFGFTQKGVA